MDQRKGPTLCNPTVSLQVDSEIFLGRRAPYHLHLFGDCSWVRSRLFYLPDSSPRRSLTQETHMVRSSNSLELIVWLVPSLIGDAIAVSFVGFVLGPMYPILMNETGRLIPPWLLTGSIGWIASFGFAGSALFPFITGALAQKFGIVSLQPL